MPVAQDERQLALALAVKYPCRVATTGAITLSGLQTVDGVALAAGNRVCVRAQSDATYNGIYIVSTSAWWRAADFSDELDVRQGTLVRIWDGDTLAGWQEVTTVSPVVDETTIDWRTWTWRTAEAPARMFSQGQASVDLSSASQVSAAMSAAGTAAGDFLLLTSQPFLSVGSASVNFVGASKVSATAYAAGSSTGDMDTAGPRPVWVFGDFAITTYVDRYSLSTDVVTSHATVANNYAGALVGNNVKAILTDWISYSAQTKKYTYATEVSANSAVFANAWGARIGAQNSTHGFFFGAYDSGTSSAKKITEKVTFSTDARVAGGDLTGNRFNGVAQGNSTRAIVAAGSDGVSSILTCDKYTYSTDTSAAGTSLSAAYSLCGASGNTTKAYIGGGNFSGNRERYVYSGDTRSMSTALEFSSTLSASGGGDNTSALWFYINTTGSGDTYPQELLLYSTEARSSASALNSIIEDGHAVAESPGGL